MFSSWASYLLGTSTAADTNQNIQNSNEFSSEENNTQQTSSLDENIQLKTIHIEDEEHDDWLLVDREEEDSLPPTDSEEELPFVEIKRSPINQRTHSSSRSHQRNGSGSALIPSRDGISQQLRTVSPVGIRPRTSMEESWFVTPPPCFTSTGPIHMETSPLENLLIEHPSMSVYHSYRSMHDLDESTLIVVNIEAQPIEREPSPERIPVNTNRAVRSRAERVEHLTHQQAKQCMLQRNAQKSHDKKTRQIYCRGALDRGNKVRDFNSQTGRSRRSDMQHCKTISRANNNRKC